MNDSLSSPWCDGSAPDPDRLAESLPELVKIVRDEIADSGPITFARFMEMALYHPLYGYYQSEERRPGRGGDFLTAPEATPLFGITLARQIAECWDRLGSPEQFVIREYGAGIGGLAYDVLAGLSEASPGAFAAAEYRLVEVSEEKLGAALTALTQAGLGDRVTAELAGVQLEPIVGVVLANEVADALPAHRLIWRDERAIERFVGWRDGWFRDVEATLSADAEQALQSVLSVVDDFQNGDRFEVSPASSYWFADALAGLQRGFALILDYGYPATDLYASPRREGLVRGYAEHTVTDDPYRRLGRQDLTAHVDFTALEQAGLHAGAVKLGITTQGDLLAALGLGDFLVQMQQDPDMTLEQYLAAQSAVLRLIDPGGLGRFRVLAMGKDVAVDPPLRGWRPPTGLF